MDKKQKLDGYEADTLGDQLYMLHEKMVDELHADPAAVSDYMIDWAKRRLENDKE